MRRIFCCILLSLILIINSSLAEEKARSAPEKVPVCIHLLDLKEGPDGIPIAYPSFVTEDETTKQIYVVDSSHGRVVVYTEDGYPLYALDRTKKVEAPTGVSIDKDGFVYIAQCKTEGARKGRITILDPCFRWKRDIFFSGFSGATEFIPRTIAVGNSHFYVSGDGFKGVLVFDRNWHFLHIISPEDELLGVKGQADICDVHVDEDGRIYLLSEGYGRIYVYNKNEKFLFKFGKKGGSSGKLSRPRGIGIEEDKHWFYVVDYMRHTVNVFDREGKYLFEFGGKGWGPGWFQYPSYVYVDKSNRILVADTFNQRVQILKVRLIKATKGEQKRILQPGIPFKLKVK